MRRGWRGGAPSSSPGPQGSSAGEQLCLCVSSQVCAPEGTKQGYKMSMDQEARPWKKDGSCLGG